MAFNANRTDLRLDWPPPGKLGREPPGHRCPVSLMRAKKVGRSYDLNACAVPGLARGLQAARIRTAGLAMLRPRASDMIRVCNPGQRGGPVDGLGPARAKTCRTDAANHDAGNRA
jgi:hypothetical protein